jgi:hypothetical protein
VVKNLPTEFDLSAGFVASLKYEDGYGSTTEFDGGSWSTQAVDVGHRDLASDLAADLN